MWDYHYKKQPKDKTLNHKQVEPGKGVIGCEMHEINGWGESYHKDNAKTSGILQSLAALFFKVPFTSNKEKP